MNLLKNIFALALLQLALVAGAAAQKPIIEDQGVFISHEELDYLVSRWSKQMRHVAIEDQGDRLELLNLAIANKKLAVEADKIARENPDVTWRYQLGLEAYQRDFGLRLYRDAIELPDFSELAAEQYSVNRDKYAAIPERRISSHILISSALSGGLPRPEALIEAQAVLDQLRDGADFVEMVKLHSGEPGAAAKEGKFDRWIISGEPGVSAPYSQGLFSIANVGEYSELVETQFGVHIIRLDGVQEKSYKSLDEVKGAIVEELQAEYIKLAMKEYVGQFQLSDEAVIDSEAVELILAPYAKQE